MKKSEYFSKDIREFLYLLHRHTVHYLIVGGEATIFYGHTRLTGDIDLLYEVSPENVKRLFDVLNDFWKGNIPGIGGTKELGEKGSIFQMGIPPNRIDLITEIEAVDFRSAWEKKKTETIAFGTKKYAIYYIGIVDLIRNKRAVSRDKDKDDLRFLLSIRKREKKLRKQ